MADEGSSTSDSSESDDERTFKCRRQGCTKRYAHKQSMYHHEKTCKKGKVVVKGAKTSFPCPNVFCKKKKVFKTAFNLKRHLLTCRHKETSRLVCPEPYCGKIFDTQYKLSRHQQQHQRSGYVCEKCWTEYSRIDHFRRHQSRCVATSSAPSSNSVSIPDSDLPSMALNDHPPVNDCASSSSSLDISPSPSTNPCSINTTTSTVGSIEYTNPLNIYSNPFLSTTMNTATSTICSIEYTNPLTYTNPSCSYPDPLAKIYTTQSARISCGPAIFTNPSSNASNRVGILVDPSGNDDVVYTSLSNRSSTSFVTQEFESISLNSADEPIDVTPPEVYVLDDILCEQQDDFEADIDFEGEVSHCTLSTLKLLKHQAKRSSVKLQEFAKLCTLLFVHKYDNEQFMTMLSNEFGFNDKKQFLDFINLDRVKISQRGRPLSNITSRQQMYDFWKRHSVLSNDRRNARHVIKIKPNKLENVVADLTDSQVTECNTKGGKSLKAQKHIYTLTVREMFEKFQREYPGVCASSSVFYRCKPFYIQPATTREMEGCLCQKCLNPHALYNTLRRNIKGLPMSLSDYLTTFFSCEKDRDLNFPKDDCINGCCKNNCTIMNDSESDEINWDKRVSYYQFQSVIEKYKDLQGTEKFYKTIARVDVQDVSLRDVYQLLMDCSKDYLLHRYRTLLDKVFWAKYLCSVNQPIMWMDYSMNVKLTEKNQVQSAHFSGCQQTLHDSLIQHTDGTYTYIYHLSDDTNHDSIMTGKIIEDIILKHPELINTGRLILRSDNCSMQYKCKYVFEMLLRLARKYNIRIDWMFGEAGHGRGLIDALAWFGCKGPLRRKILTTDRWFRDAEQMRDFLANHFSNDERKEYILIDPNFTAEMRRKGRDARQCPGCRSCHVMSFFSDGSVKMWKTIKDFMEDQETEVSETMVGEEEQQQFDWVESIESLDSFELIEIGSFIAIRAIKGHPEMFHLMEVMDKKIATEHISDSSEEHAILKGEPYIIGKWYSFNHDGKKAAIYNKSTNTENALIHVGEIISSNIEITENSGKYQMDIADYRMLVCSLT